MWKVEVLPNPAVAPYSKLSCLVQAERHQIEPLAMSLHLRFGSESLIPLRQPPEALFAPSLVQAMSCKAELLLQEMVKEAFHHVHLIQLLRHTVPSCIPVNLHRGLPDLRQKIRLKPMADMLQSHCSSAPMHASFKAGSTCHQALSYRH
jgi:hypothetical protein